MELPRGPFPEIFRVVTRQKILGLPCYIIISCLVGEKWQTFE